MELIKWIISCAMTLVGLCVIIGLGGAFFLASASIGGILLVVAVVLVVAAGVKEAFDNWLRTRRSKRRAP